MHEVRVRKMLERWRTPGYTRWYLAGTGRPMDDSAPIFIQHRQLLLIGQPFAIDPLFAVEAPAQSNPGNVDYFPFVGSGGGGGLNYPRLGRLRLDIFEGNLMMTNSMSPPYYYQKSAVQKAALSAMQLPVFDRIFTWPDDLTFDLDEDDPDRRPRQSCLWSDGAVDAYKTPQAGGPNPLHAVSEGNYTWMLTAVPDPSELPNSATIPMLAAHKQKTYEVSIVTFYKRDFTCDAAADVPSERFVGIAFQGTGIGGGDAVLTSPVTVASRELAEEYLKVKENEWIMVTAFVLEPRLNPIFAPQPGVRRIAKWYRVIRVDDEVEGPVSGSFTRQITLAGPDWQDTTLQGSATIIEGAIGVYTTTVTLE